MLLWVNFPNGDNKRNRDCVPEAHGDVSLLSNCDFHLSKLNGNENKSHVLSLQCIGNPGSVQGHGWGCQWSLKYPWGQSCSSSMTFLSQLAPIPLFFLLSWNLMGELNERSCWPTTSLPANVAAPLIIQDRKDSCLLLPLFIASSSAPLKDQEEIDLKGTEGNAYVLQICIMGSWGACHAPTQWPWRSVA